MSRRRPDGSNDRITEFVCDRRGTAPWWFATSMAALVVVNADGEIVAANPTAHAMLGRDELVGRRSSLFFTLDVDLIRSTFDRSAHRAAIDGISGACLSEGRWIDVATRARLIIWHDGEQHVLLEMFEALPPFAIVGRSANDIPPELYVDTRGTVVDANDAACALFRREADQLIGLRLSALMTHEIGAGWASICTSVCVADRPAAIDDVYAVVDDGVVGPLRIDAEPGYDRLIASIVRISRSDDSAG